MQKFSFTMLENCPNHVYIWAIVKLTVYFFQDGLSVLCKGMEFHFKGTAVLFVGDTPASGYAGGFKEGVGGVFQKCRCMVMPQQISTKVQNVAGP